jgi:hypothetical protein
MAIVDSGSGDASSDAERRAARRRWADLIRRIYEVDPLVCSNCGGPMKIIAFITERKAIRGILASMRKSAAPASPSGSRSPPPPARQAGDAGA